jgi:hypothetical protein
VVIDKKGTILTNYHVVTSDDDYLGDPAPSAYQICLSESVTKEPDCFYYAKLIARDKDLDLALLQIENIPDLGKTKFFPYLNLNGSDTTNVGDSVKVIGYPDIGAETITISDGIISGKDNKYEKKWLKTDAVASFGNSGGATIDKNGNVVGITSAGHADLLGSLGYVLNITSINDWVTQNKIKTAEASFKDESLFNLSKKQLILKTSNKFINSNPGFSLEKPGDWQFVCTGEAGVSSDKKSDDEGGQISFDVSNYPYAIDVSNIMPEIKNQLWGAGASALTEVSKEEDLKIGGQPAKKILLSSMMGGDNNFYFIPYGRHLIGINYNYGKNDKDNEKIDNIIKSLVFTTPSAPTAEIKKFTYDKPKLNLDMVGAWQVMSKNSIGGPAIFLNKNFKDAAITLNFDNIDDNKKDISLADYFKIQKNQVNSINTMGSILDLNVKIIKSDLNYKINPTSPAMIRMEAETKKVSTDEILGRNATYYVKLADRYLEIDLQVLSPDKKVYDSALNEFDQIVKTLTY